MEKIIWENEKGGLIMKNICLTMFILILLLSPLNVIAQNTEDIAVPPGYKVYKIADSNRIYRPAGLVFDSSGDILVAGYRAQKIYKNDLRGDV